MNQVKTYLGKRGTGKSCRMLKDLKLLPKVILYDTLGEDTYNEFERCTTFNELVERLKQQRSYFRIAYRGYGDKLQMDVDFEFCCRAILACENIHFAVEEIGLHCNSWKIPPALQTIISAGRHRNISFSCTSQRASNVHPLIRALSTDIITFLQTEPRDIEWLREVIGDRADDVPNLPQYQFIHWNDKAYSQNIVLPETEGSDTMKGE